MFYSDSLVDEIRTRNDIVDVISSYVRLTKKGSNYFGLCPFHNEKSGSFSVSPSRQMYHCFGCGVGGNVITFIMEYENYSFSEALKYLADRAGIDLPEVDNKEERAKNSKRSRLLEINKEVGKLYYVGLRSESGAKAMQYLKGRGLTDDTIKQFGLGYARPARDETYRYLKSKGFEDDLLNESGLFNYRESQGMMDKFWNRVIYPIMDVNHRIIGFGGRVMGEGEPKYLNSPETMIFDKGRNLYGLNLARTSRKKNFILCEGYMDVISLHQAGFNQAVASLGTAFTSGQANLLRRYTEEVLLCYDSDGAGVKAALRALPILRQAGISAKVINMRPYKDPDEFIKNLGADEFQKRIDSAQNGFYYEIDCIESEFDINDPESKTKFFNEVAKRLLRFDEEIERDNYIEAISRNYSISSESLKKLVAKYAMKAEGITVAEPARSGIHTKRLPDEGIRMTQGMLLTWLCDQPKVYGQISRYISADDFSNPLYRSVAQMLFAQIEEDRLCPAEIVSRFTEEEEQREVAALFHAKMQDMHSLKEKEEALKDLIIRIKNDGFNKRITGEELDDLQRMINEKRALEEINKIKIDLSIQN